MARRSVLFTPADRPEMCRKAPDSGADVVVFDLEDAVAPARMDEARDALADLLTSEFDPDCEVCVRVTGEYDADLDVLLDGDPRLDALMLPKVERGEDVAALADAIAAHDATYPVFALIETAAGVLAADTIAAADATTAVCFGAEDLAADLGARRTDAGTEVLYARERTVLAASAAGVDAIDTLVTDIDATERLREDAELALDFGYDGKLAIHPAQVTVINDAYTPADERIAWAERVLDAKADADAEDRGVFRVDGEMIDAPLIAQAERVLDRARTDDP
ncbi:CoA ester lyase [Halococcus dombrowskii]|uniref:CoA ester lyase n=2 Tax=Halococcus dombrowskii TaxID=179637 RepID=A0AAX3ALQ3_HALDO|nr:CoA ester lyase [Halococcus dombrowskii]UOO94735.1 CoA ester lyase [Halococcus dombrowskii]